MILHNDGSYWKKSAFPQYIVFMMKQRPQFGWATSRVDDTRSSGSVLILYSKGGCGSSNVCMQLFELFEKSYMFFVSTAKCRNIVK